MAKMTWNAFVKKHGTGHCLTTGLNVTQNRKPPPGVAANGETWPSYREMVDKVVAAVVQDDWGARTENTTIKRDPRVKGSKTQTVSMFHYIFKSSADCRSVAKTLGATIQALTTSSQVPCVTHDSAPPFEEKAYGAFAKHFGYAR